MNHESTGTLLSAMVRFPYLPTSGMVTQWKAIGLRIKRSMPSGRGQPLRPTAGLHFTDRLFASLAHKGITWVDLTLHIGVGTFRPIEVEDLTDHMMHAEWAELSA